MDDFIVYKGIEKSFGPKHVLRGVDLSIPRGETVVIMGASGSGKSVLIRHTIGLYKPDAGEILVDHTPITGYSEEELMPVRRKVGMLFQGGALFDSMNVFENVAFALREHTQMTEEEIGDRVHEVLGLVELSGVDHLTPSDLSGGMKKRVALARAIAISPAGILYDEPTTGLDPITADAINRLIRNLQAALQVTSIVVTHDIKSAFTVGDRIAFLHEGRMSFVGTVAEARSTPDPRLREFLHIGSTGDIA